MRNAKVLIGLLAALTTGYPLCAFPAEYNMSCDIEENQDNVPAREMPLISHSWKGDFDGMVKRRIIRVLVPYSKTLYYVEKGHARGVSAEIITLLEAMINRDIHRSTLKVKLVAVPVSRDRFVSKIVDGYGDVVIAGITITPERRKLVDFSKPMFSNITEIVVTGISGPEIQTVDDLSGKTIYVRPDTSYWEHLLELNKKLASAGRMQVRLMAAPGEFEAEDIMEMLDAGLIEATVMDSYKARMWQPVFKNLMIHEDAILSVDNDYAFMLRKNSPKWKAVLNKFVNSHKGGTAFGNSIINRYVNETDFVKNAAGLDESRRFGEVVDTFRKYSDIYDLDYLLMMALAFQESKLNQDAVSPAGAIGIMQIMPDTGRKMDVGDISIEEYNIHAGVKYIRLMLDQYFENQPMTQLNKVLFTFASYNAGPGRIATLRSIAAKRGLDPNEWFNNVELVAADMIGPETVTFVANIYKYYNVYKLMENQYEERLKALDEGQKRKPL